MDAIERARADLTQGRAWKARDRLVGLLTQRQDPEVLDLLAQVHYDMGDLPAAGALWFVTERTDTPAILSAVAWKERHGDAHAQWRSIPAPVRASVTSQRLTDLRRANKRADPQQSGRRREQAGGSNRADFGCAVLGVVAVLAVLALIGVGLVTVLQWIAT